MMTEPQERNFTVVPIIPMKPLAEGKTRLGRQFDQSQRADLAAGMLQRVISAIKGASIELFWVIGGDERVTQLVRNEDGIWLPEMGRNLNDTVSKAFATASQEGYSALYLPGDLPFIKPSDVINLIRSSERRNNITLAPAVILTITEKKLLGCVLGSSNSLRDIPRLIALWQAGRLDLEGLITARRPLSEINEAMDDLRASRGIRTVLSM